MPIRPADADGLPLAPRDALSATCSSIIAMIQASSPTSAEFFNSLLERCGQSLVNGRSKAHCGVAASNGCH